MLMAHDPCLTILEKIKETRPKSSHENVTVSQKFANCEDVRVKLKSTQLNKLKSAAKYKARTTLWITKKKISRWRIV